MLSAICLFKLDLFYSVVWKKAKTTWKERVLLKNLWRAGVIGYTHLLLRKMQDKPNIAVTQNKINIYIFIKHLRKLCTN